MNLGDLHKELSLTKRYLFAVLVFAVALSLRLTLLPVSYPMTFATFYPALIITFYLFGSRPGILVAFLSISTASYIFMPPYWEFSFNIDMLIGSTVFLISATLIGLAIKKLQLSEELYSDLLQTQTEVICRFHLDGTFIYVNDAFCRFFGKERSELIGHKWHPVVYDQDFERVNRELQTLSPTHPVVMIENRIYDGRGNVRWGQFINHAVYDEHGHLIEIQSVGRDITDTKLLEKELRDSKLELDDLYNHAPCGYHSIGPDGIYLRINETELSWLGYTREEIIGKKKCTDFFTPASLELFNQAFPVFMNDGYISGLEFEIVKRDGTTMHVGTSATLVKDDDGNMLYTRSVMYDITELYKAEEKLRLASLEQFAMLNTDLVGIVKMRDRHLIWLNKAMLTMFGYEHAELYRASSRIFYTDDASYQALGAEAYPILEAEGVFRKQLKMVRKDGRVIWVDLSGVLLPGSRKDSLWMLSDITVLKEREEIAIQIAYHDPLTGLPNRLLLSDRLTQGIAQAVRTNTLLLVCYLDFDGFKPINDNYGHDAGDTLLKVIAERMLAAVRANDTVCRLGGDEFVLLLTHLQNVEEYEVVLNRVIEAISTPVAISDSINAKVTASIGITVFPFDQSEPDVLIRHADVAMYQAKNSGRNRVYRYEANV